MEKTTVLARMRYSIRFTPEMVFWLGNYPGEWFSQNGGDDFLHEFGGAWREIIKIESQATISNYFEQIGVPPNSLPYFQDGESYKGSWIIDATVLMAGTIGSSYLILKSLSELPQIAKGLSELRAGLESKIAPAVNERIRDTIGQVSVKNQSEIKAPKKLNIPVSPAALDLVIDARPLTALSPDAAKSHSLALAVAVSRSAVSIENLGNEDMSDVRVGLFRTPHERKQWSYTDAYMGHFALISAGQTYLKASGDFVDRSGNRFDLSDDTDI